ncbi:MULTISPECIES: high frequency lysogenization protein HflD [unclassified Hahella]|uniref:high frequency lysogenization protein HflD n=1 Tax=unclassified Hahella TaxID=2624107 RepID=UPI001C1EA37A|nr:MULTISPECIES: high frequency lysogenization protein HflD [unclassified Hahella]MBU6950735.1 high frequency lysogenization protein HflD [Hahella sp. HN01]MDG9667373.1 high frequency lysogenization protein HflD [Hahella sp. CR1]
MSYNLENQVIALAGVFQSAALVDQLAKQGTVAPTSYECSLKSLLKVDATSTLDVYGDIYGVQLGLKELIAVLERKQDRKKVDVVRYALTLLYLEGKVNKRGDMLDVMSQRIAQITTQTLHFDPTHTNIISAFASLYSDTISTFPQRIQVTGDPRFLRVDENADKIRALLLAGIRAAVLWRQVGGRRWKLFFMRKKILQIANGMLR